MKTPDKYSLWLVPQGSEGEKLQNFVNTLAQKYNAPVFVPHLTLVANIFIPSEHAYDSLEDRVEKLAESRLNHST